MMAPRWRRRGGVAPCRTWTPLITPMGTLESCLRREEKMDLIGHDGEAVKLVVAVGSVVLKGFDKKFGLSFSRVPPNTGYGGLQVPLP